MYCKTCGAQLVTGATICSGCGATLARPLASVVCRACSHPATSGAKFCKKCGASLDEVRSAAAAASATSVGSLPRTVSATVTVQPVQTADEDSCPHCGAVIRKGANFCKTCGKSRLPSELSPALTPPNRAGGSAPPSVTRPPDALSSAKPQSTKSKTRTFVVTSAVVVLILGTAGAAYWKLIYRNNAQRATSTQNASSQPPAPAPATAPAIDAAINPQASEQPTGGVTTYKTTKAQNPAQEAQTPSGGSESPPAAPSPIRSGIVPSRNRAVAPASQRAAVAPPVYQQAHTNAEQAFAAAQYIEPPNNSALYWARMASQQGDPGASQIEFRVLEQVKAIVQAQRASRNYDYAATLLSRLIQLFPDRTELQQMGSSLADEQQAYNRQLEQQRKAQELYTRQLELQRKAAEFKTQTKVFRLRHRHFLGLQSQNLNAAYGYCEGVLRITPDGAAKFDCTRADAGGRCDHLSLTGEDIKEIQVKNDGVLHLGLRSGKFDFMADQATIQAAADALSSIRK